MTYYVLIIHLLNILQTYVFKTLSTNSLKISADIFITFVFKKGHLVKLKILAETFHTWP
jgi:hypothetical protein